MEGKKQLGSSPSFTSELFGSKDSSSSTGIFGSIFAPPSKVLGRGSLQSEVMGKKKQDYANEAWNTKPEAQDETSTSNEGEGYNIPSRDTSSFYQEQRVQPCHLSSSIYYGGQDIYHHPQNSQNANMTSMFKKDGTEDDSGSASRGNWWQGSLYY